MQDQPVYIAGKMTHQSETYREKASFGKLHYMH